jgi:hypothetical protein
VAGAGNGFTVWLLRHSQRKRGATARLDLRNTAPVLDPTKNLFVFYKPTGALSGETTAAIFLWLITWAILNWRWRTRNISLPRINIIALVLLGLSLSLTFPPIGDLF